MNNYDSTSPALSIIVPTYNEAANVPLLLWLIDEACGSASIDYEVVVVDDASPDGTQDAVRRMAALLAPGRVRLRTRPGKLGLGTAYGAGLSAARAPWVLLMDADLSHHPKYIPSLVEMQARSGADVVAATRYALGGGVAGWDWRRKLTSRGANVLASTLLGLRISDLTGAFRLYRTSLLRELLAASRARGYAFQMEIAARASAAGAAIAEVPIVFVDRVYGASKLGAGEYAQFAVGLARLLLTL
jgi:dolichol-phosphate mannosyltransferase